MHSFCDRESFQNLDGQNLFFPQLHPLSLAPSPFLSPSISTHFLPSGPSLFLPSFSFSSFRSWPLNRTKKALSAGPDVARPANAFGWNLWALICKTAPQLKFCLTTAMCCGMRKSRWKSTWIFTLKNSGTLTSRGPCTLSNVLMVVTPLVNNGARGWRMIFITLFIITWYSTIENKRTNIARLTISKYQQKHNRQLYRVAQNGTVFCTP